MSGRFAERTGGLRVRTAGRADCGALIGLFNEAFRKSKDDRTCAWKYFDGPHGASLTLLAEGPASEPAGAYSYVFRRMTWRGTPFVGSQASDAMVSTSFRKRGIFTSLDDEVADAAAARGVPFCFATAGRQSLHGFLKNGWREIGAYRTWIAVFDLAAALATRFPRPVAACIAAVLGPLLRLGGRMPRRDRPRSTRTRRVERFDARADALYAAVSCELPLAGVRDAAWLNWRYVDTPTGRHRIHLAERGAQLVGYAVVEDGGGQGFVVDLLGLDADAEDAALGAALDDLRGRGLALAYFNTLPCARVRSLLRRNGLMPHPKRQPFRFATPFIVRVLRTDLEPAPEVFLDPGSWYVMDGDRDVEHMAPVVEPAKGA